MVGIAHLLTTLLCLSSLSATNALPQKRVDNSTCCGYVVTNRGDAFFNYKHIIDFSTVGLFPRLYPLSLTSPSA